MSLKLKINNQNPDKTIRNVLAELKLIKSQLAKLLLLIPQDSLDNYKNSRQIKKDFFDALNEFPPV